VHVLPEFFAVSDTICEGGSYLVGTQVYTQTGVYTDSLISSIGCDSILTLDLTVLPDLGITSDILAIDPTCAGGTNGSFSIDNIQNAYPPVQIEFAGNTINDNAAAFDNLGANSYSIIISDNYGCFTEQTIAINDPVPFNIDVGPDLMVDLGDFIQINTSSNYNIDNVVWEPEIDIECFDGCLRLTGIPTTSNQYIVTAVSELGCVTTDTLFIEVNAVRDVYIPNAFSPNDDGFNDVFTIFGKEPAVEAIEEFRVFNRWGSVVFEAENIPPNDQTAGWNGKFGGKSLGSDVYIYQIVVRYLDGITQQFSGDILLLR
jgi:gliding motility-associated-like protein